MTLESVSCKTSLLLAQFLVWKNPRQGIWTLAFYTLLFGSLTGNLGQPSESFGLPFHFPINEGGWARRPFRFLSHKNLNWYITPEMKTEVVERDFIQSGWFFPPRLDQFEEVIPLSLAKAMGFFSLDLGHSALGFWKIWGKMSCQRRLWVPQQCANSGGPLLESNVKILTSWTWVG